MGGSSNRVKLDSWHQLEIYSPLLRVLGISIIFGIFVLGPVPLDFRLLCGVAAILCLIGFFLTGVVSSKILRTIRVTSAINFARATILAAHPEKEGVEIKALLVAHANEVPPMNVEEENLTLPQILGTGGIYGIVFGLGVTNAIEKYIDRTSGAIANYFANHTAINQTLGVFTNSTNYVPSIVPILQLNLPETFRFAGFLFTIIPFIHVTILMFSKKWYLDTDSNPHYFVALLYFIVVFIITIMYFFVALNILDTAFFIYSLWLVMAFNSMAFCLQQDNKVEVEERISSSQRMDPS
jgi:hypothetical protein